MRASLFYFCIAVFSERFFFIELILFLVGLPLYLVTQNKIGSSCIRQPLRYISRISSEYFSIFSFVPCVMLLWTPWYSHQTYLGKTWVGSCSCGHILKMC